jgi:hypothetical protein
MVDRFDYLGVEFLFNENSLGTRKN